MKRTKRNLKILLLTVKEYVRNNGGKVISMVRFGVGEGIEKRQENFAEEVAAQMNAA